MWNFHNRFWTDEDGAITVDWDVLTAAVVALAGSVILSIQGGNQSVATNIENNISGITVDSGL